MQMHVNLDYRQHNWRLGFHLQTAVGWLSDPNGLCQFNGEYHIFHQYAPRWPWAGHGWGHWTSTDMITWEFHRGAIIPEMELDKNGSYSGSAVVRDGEMWCYYTGNVLEPGEHNYDYDGRQANETLVTSKDGRTFSDRKLVLGNDGYPNYCSCHVRDPKVWWQNDTWNMLLGARTMDDHPAMLLYQSPDGINDWKLAGSCTTINGKPFGYMWECPNIVTLGGREFFFVCPQGVPSRLTKFQNNFNSGYFPVEGTVIDLLSGDKELMDAKKPYGCIDEDTFIELDYGFDFYAPQVFTDEKGRQILVGWMGLPDIEMQYQVPTYEWLHTLTWLRELSLNDAGKICQWPCEEYNALRGARVDFTAEGAKDSNGKLGTSNYDAFDIEGAIGAKFANGTADVRLKGIEGEGRILLNADLELAVINDMIELSFKGIAGGYRTVRRLPLSELSAGKLEDLRMVVDTSAIEIYVNGGEHTMSTRWWPQQITNLNITSTFAAAETYAYEMGRFTFLNVC